MELQLGLALPNNPVKGFDLNINHVYDYEPKENMGSDTWRLGCDNNNDNKKRSYDKAFKFEQKSRDLLLQTLPLLLWNDQPNEDDDREDLQKRSSYTITKDDGEGHCIVGWPPIKSWMKKMNSSSQQQDGRVDNIDQRVENGCSGLKCMYVKVKMDGVAIARKVDLSLHHSYQTLTDTLISMFGKYEKGVKRPQHEYGRDYTLTYQDKEGDWLLAGDVPWQTFIKTVQRLKIIGIGG